jgi:hypothetical protein
MAGQLVGACPLALPWQGSDDRHGNQQSGDQDGLEV